MAEKDFKTIDEQIDILESRGLKIEDKNKAKMFLKRNNYYRISGYSLTLRDHDVFSPMATFQNIIDIYEFDHEFRHILLKYLEIIEVTVKSVFSYHFTKVYGPTGYLDENNFTDINKHDEIIKKAEAQKTSRLPHEAYLKHFVNELNQNIPLWAYVDLLTISDISFLYKIAPTGIKEVVANELNLNNKGAELLEHFMHRLTIIRNLCAHGSRLYNRLFEQKPRLSKTEKQLLIKDTDGNLDNSHLYGYIIIMKRLLGASEFENMKSEVIQLSKKYPFVQMKYYGFRDDWITNL